MGQPMYHYIKNYSNFGKIGISYDAIGNVIREVLKDLPNIIIAKNVVCETKDDVFIVNLSIKVNYGININDITAVIQEKIESALINTCDIRNAKINVKVDGIIVK